MIVRADALCMGCMEIKHNGLCPNPDTCGWLEGLPNESPLQLQPRTRVREKYLVGKVLGQGGFGITYLSFNLDNNRKLAVKEYFPRSFATRTIDQQTVTHSSPDNRPPYEYGLNKFIQEAKTLERLRGHANIVSVIEFFPENNTAYIVMEYLDGITLETYLRDHGGKIPFDQSLRIMVPVMDALREVHAANLVHRDVSPDNIILSKSGPIKLIDFGAAKQTVLQGQKTQQLILKAGYTPEEQYRSDAVAGPTTDVYATGATLYRCITGVVPPEAPSRMFEDTLVAPSKMGVQLTRHADRAIMKALAVRANNRYPNMREFQEDLTKPGTGAELIQSHISEPIPQKSTSRRSFHAWWISGFVVIFVGSFFDRGFRLVFLLFGIIAFAMSGQARKRLNRSGKGTVQDEVDTRPNLLLLLALVGCLVLAVLPTAVAPWGVIALLPAVFVAISLGGNAKKEIRKKTPDPPDPPVRPQLGLRIDTGDQLGETVAIGNATIIIGRDPAASNLVIRAGQVSGVHVKVWRNEGGGLNIQDLRSRNGTYIRKSNGNGQWERLVQPEILFEGDSFYLSEKSTALFQVVNL